MAYDSKAAGFVYSFYARGWSRAKALPEIQKVYAGFAGSTWDEWEKRYDWKQRRALADAKLREFEDKCNDINRTLLLEMDDARGRLYKKIQDGEADTQTYYAFSQLANRTADLSANYFSSRDPGRIATQVVGDVVEHILSELQSVPGIRAVLQANSAEVGRIAAGAAERFGQ
ncbi:MAG TPA: hypothetical protein VFC21_01400 [Bryobacteraceae bacterium]|nr:hypothetical protein [Bryobacteraceae bacterium]